MKPVDKHARAPKDGRPIVCPHCDKATRVYHFAWCAITCNGCGQLVNKEDFSTGKVEVTS
jgi:ribosomal protein S27E